jgi:ADP-heptose:LPS heptosyltransferase
MHDDSAMSDSREAILAIKLGALGDVLLAIGALRDIRERHGLPLAVLTRRPYLPILARCPWVDAAIGDPGLPRWRPDGWWQLWRALRRWRFARVYDLQNSRRSASYRRLLLAHVPSSALPPHTLMPPENRPARTLPAPERLAAQLSAAGIAPRHTLSPALDWLAAPVEALLASASLAAPFVVLLPGSSRRHAGKRWPHYRALARRLVGDGLRVAIIPGPEEPEIGPDWPGTVLRSGGRALDVFELAGVLERASAVVGNDSGPTHLADLLGRPGLALFGPASPPPEQTGLGRRRLRVLEAEALAELGPERVHEALLAQLSPR